MRTLVYKIKVSDLDKEFLKNYQKDYSIDFRKIYMNFELQKDSNFIKSLRIKNSKLLEYTLKEVIAFKEKYNSTQTKILDKINENQELLNKSNDSKIKNKLFKKITLLKQSLKSNICFGGRLNLQKRTKNLITNEEFKEFRLYPITFYGETATKGNRFFELNDLSNGNLIFKPSKNKHIHFNISNKKHKEILKSLELFSKNKELPITIKLTHDKIFITYDESKLNRTYFNLKLYQKNKPKDLSKEETKLYWKSKYQEHQTFLKQGKLERYLSIDINPNEIGYSISDDKLNILDKGCFKIIGKVNESKRKFEYSQIVKTLFKKVKHFKVSYFIIEDLENLNQDNYGNKVSNRKNKLEFKKNYIFSLIQRRCNETGTILRKVPAYYSSFIGNLTYKEYDPIASSIELLRRGINQYIKGFKMIPEFNKDNIFTDKIDKYVDLNNYTGFMELFKSIRNKSYRRKDITFSRQLFTKSLKSHVIHVV